MDISPCIWSLAKLQQVNISRCSFFEQKVLEEDSKLEYLRILRWVRFTYSEDTKEFFQRFPNLRSLNFIFNEPRKCPAEKIRFPRLDVLNELEEVTTYFRCGQSGKHTHQWDFHLPSSLKKLVLSYFHLSSHVLSRIARSLPNLQDLHLELASIQGGEWNMEQVIFQNLKSLTLYKMSFSEWQVNGEESFPVLEELQMEYCDELKEIPDSLGNIASLKSISLWNNYQLKDSAIKIKEYVEEMTGEDKLELIGVF